LAGEGGSAVTLRPKGKSPIKTPVEAQKATRRLLESIRNPPVAEPPPLEPPPMKRSNWLPAPAAFNLSMACVTVNKAFGDSFGCYLVGSSLRKRDYRDVDVRLIISDEGFAKLFGEGFERHPLLSPLWALMCSSISLFLQTHTGLPVDFQIQQQTKANEEFGGPGHGRHPLGLFVHAHPNPRDYAADIADGVKL
jgi:hypothetical protein